MDSKIKRHVGKGSKSELLPSRYAKAELTGGDAFQRSMNNYAKKTPVGNIQTPNIYQMGRFA